MCCRRSHDSTVQLNSTVPLDWTPMDASRYQETLDSVVPRGATPTSRHYSRDKEFLSARPWPGAWLPLPRTHRHPIQNCPDTSDRQSARQRLPLARAHHTPVAPSTIIPVSAAQAGSTHTARSNNPVTTSRHTRRPTDLDTCCPPARPPEQPSNHTRVYPAAYVSSCWD